MLRGFAKPAQFALLSRDFFARLTRRYLDYYLSRELPKHVGLNRRFPTLFEHEAFEEALETHCREVSLIVLKYSGQWFAKYTRNGVIEPPTAGGFIAYGFEKVRRELAVRRDAGT